MTVTLPGLPDFDDSDDIVDEGLTKFPPEDEVGDETVFEPVSIVVTLGHPRLRQVFVAASRWRTRIVAGSRIQVAPVLGGPLL